MAASAEQILFVDSSRTALVAGDYVVGMSQTLDIPKLDDLTGPATSHALKAPAGRTFHVSGPRFRIQPSWVRSVFPPAGAHGDFGNVFPQVVLDRTTLPWERSGFRVAPSPAPPGLAVLVFDDSEVATRFEDIGKPGILAVDLSVPVALADLKTASKTTGGVTVSAGPPAQTLTASQPPVADETGDDPQSMVAFIDVDATAVQDMLPKPAPAALATTPHELDLLSHVRENYRFDLAAALAPDLDTGTLTPGLVAALAAQGVHAPPGVTVKVLHPTRHWRIASPHGAFDLELVLASPAAGPTIQVGDAPRAVVVSRRLPHPGSGSRAYLVSLADRYSNGAFDLAGAGAGDRVRLVVLHTWRFSSAAGAKTLDSLFHGLSHPAWPHAAGADLLALTVPTDPASFAAPLTAAGYCALPHTLRTGGQTWSLVRSPLARTPVAPPATSPLPARSSDALLRYDTETGLLDTTYAAAWELGRLLAMARSDIALAIHDWRVAARRFRRLTVQQSSTSQHLVSAAALTPPPLPDVLGHWLMELALLSPVPFGYLVPDAKMLPVESLRVFRVDVHWLHCVVDGAFSVGRVLFDDVQLDQQQLGGLLAATAARLPSGWDISGLILRSEIVAGWPHLQIEATAAGAAGPPLKMLRRAVLSDNVLLVLFAGEAATIRLHPHPQALHAGLDVVAAGGFSKTARDATGAQVGAALPVALDASRNVDMATLATQLSNGGSLGTITSAGFGMQLLEGIPRLVVTV